MAARIPAPVHRLGAWVLNRDDARSKRRRRRWLRGAAPMTPAVVADMQGAPILVRTADPYVSGAVFANGHYDDATELTTAVRVLNELGRAGRIDGGTFVDLGANIGTATISALTSHGFARGVAVEPEPGNLALLRANVALNDLHERVTVLPIAVGAQDGTVELVVNAENPGDHRIADRGTDSPRPDTLSVPVRSVDSLVASGEIVPEEVGLLWIDVQGFEPEVLRGASRLIDAGVPAVIEYSPGHMSDTLRQLQEFVAERYDQLGDLREGRNGRPVRLRPAREITLVRPAGNFTDLLLIPG